MLCRPILFSSKRELISRSGINTLMTMRLFNQIILLRTHHTEKSITVCVRLNANDPEH